MCRRIGLSVLGLLIFTTLRCGVDEKIYKRDMNALKSQLNELENEKGTLVDQANTLRNQLKVLKEAKGSLSAELRAALLKIEELKALAAKRREVFDKLMRQLQGLADAGKLKVRIVRGMFVVELAEGILFDTGKFKLKPEGEAALQELTPILATLRGRRWQIGGHTDIQGNEWNNWKLSCNRALSVLKFMIEQGMPQEALSAAGFGQYQPVASNDSPEGMALNRRIEIILVPNLAELQPFK